MKLSSSNEWCTSCAKRFDCKKSQHLIGNLKPECYSLDVQ